MRHYETIYIINPNMVDDTYQEVISKYNDIIEKEKGVLIKVDEWGTQKMAYDVGKFDRGSYILIEYCGLPGLTAELERYLKLDDRILLYQTVKLADTVDPEELLLKEEETKKARAAVQEKKAPETAPAPEKEPTKEEVAAPKEEKEDETASEVKNGIS